MTEDVRAQAQAAPTGSSGFNWFANASYSGTPNEALQEARLAVQRAGSLSNGASWICSPAGSGKPSRCYKG